MGQAKRRKDLGVYPDVKPKPRSVTRLKAPLEVDPYQSYLGTSGTFALLNLIAHQNRERGEVRE